MRRTPLLTFAGAVMAAFVSMTSTSTAQTATGQMTRLKPGCAEEKIVSTMLDLMRRSGQ